MSTYSAIIQRLTLNIPSSLVDFNTPRDKGRIPTQASSNFITNKEQGDWAEDVLFRAINENSNNIIAVRYGKSDNIIAGDDGFSEFYESYQQELDKIGKRPDILLFRKEDFNESLGNDISQIPHADILEYVKKAIAGIEVRSSAFLIDKYDEIMRLHTDNNIKNIIETREIILKNYKDILEESPKRKQYINILESITENNVDIINFKSPSWRSSDRLVQLSNYFKNIKDSLKEIQKRDYLSITPKVEDLKVVNKWIETTGVPHYYVQVFFDKIYGISFENILRIISDTNNEDKHFTVEADEKNQNKTTIKINTKTGICIASRVDEPAHNSVRKEMSRGRLLFYVHFNGGNAYLDTKNFELLFGAKI